MAVVVQMEQQDDIYILRLKGRMVISEDLPSLRASIDQIRNRNLKKLLADFTEVTYIDSTIIGFLVSIYTSVTKSEGGRFVLAGSNYRVLQVLDLTRLSSIIPMAPDVESGFALLRD